MLILTQTAPHRILHSMKNDLPIIGMIEQIFVVDGHQVLLNEKVEYKRGVPRAN